MSAPKEAYVGALRLTPATFDGVGFGIGLVTIPSGVNILTSLSDRGILPRVNLAVSRSVSMGATLITHLATKGSSFGLGALLGQIPGTVDAIMNEITGSYGEGAKITPEPQVGPPAKAEGIGQAAEAEALEELRREIQEERVSGLGRRDDGDGFQRGAFDTAEVGGQPMMMAIRER